MVAQLVSSYAIAVGDGLLLVDPLCVPAELHEQASAVILTAPYHERDARRLGLPVHTSPADTWEDWVEKFGADPERVRGMESDDLDWLRRGEGEAHFHGPGPWPPRMATRQTARRSSAPCPDEALPTALAPKERGEVDAVAPPVVLGREDPPVIRVPEALSELATLQWRPVVGETEELSLWLAGHDFDPTPCRKFETVTGLCLFVSVRRADVIVPAMAWEIELKAQVRQWQRSLDPVRADRVTAALAQLEERGPRLGRPLVDSIKGSRHHQMKELRVGNMRALFAFDARRRAVVLVAGDKTNDWSGWYQRNVPVADRAFERHQRSIGGGGQRWQGRATSARPAGREQ